MTRNEPRTIVLTGCSRGLGRAMLEGFLERAHRVAGCARSPENLAELARKYSNLRIEAVDVRDDAAVKAWSAKVLDQWGPPDLLVNNAAVMNRPAPLWEISSEEFDAVLAANVAGVANCIRHFVPAMVANRRGVIVNFSSGWGRSTSPEVAPYCATKYAIEGLSLALAQELPDGMAAVPLNPGVIDTDMLRLCWADEAAHFVKPDAWARRAVPFILGIGSRDNGESLTVPS